MINRICISLIFFITSLLSSLSGKELDIRDKELIEKEQAYQKILQKILEDSKDKEMMIGIGKKLYGTNASSATAKTAEEETVLPPTLQKG